MKQNKTLTIGSLLFIVFTTGTISLCSCYNFNNKTQLINIERDSARVSYIDTLPSFEYSGLKRKIKPAKQLINGKYLVSRDSLLSIYLEDNVHCPNYCEGVFQYIIQLDINETGKIEKVTFEEDKYNSDTLQLLITEALKKIQLEPAIKNKKTIPITVNVNVLIDLYNYPSKIRKAFFSEQ